MLTSLQTIAQTLVNEHPIAVIVGAFGGLATLLAAALKVIANGFLSAVAKLEGKVDNFTTALATHGTEDDRRFDDISKISMLRHEALMETIQEHAEQVSTILTPLQVTVGILDETVKGLRSDLQEGKR